METIERKGKTYVLVEQSEYERLTAMPAFPQADAAGNMPALEYARASIARDIITRREAIGWSQAELARQAKLQVATLNRIEKAKVTPDEATVKRLTKAMEKGEAIEQLRTNLAKQQGGRTKRRNTLRLIGPGGVDLTPPEKPKPPRPSRSYRKAV